VEKPEISDTIFPYLVLSRLLNPIITEEVPMFNDRSRAWRRHTNQIKNGKGMGTEPGWKPEKNWKRINYRSQKLQRAKQLGFDYPTLSTRQLLEKTGPQE